MFSVIFPGQGSQIVGMGKELHAKFDTVKKLFNEADQILDFSIVILDHSIGHEYILIYKNFETRNLALDYCYHYLKTIDTCLIVNVQKLD